MAQHAWRIAAGAGALAGVGFLVLEDALLREILWRLVLIGAAAGVALGVRLHRPDRSHPWWILFVALVLLTMANLVTFPLWTSTSAQLVADLLSVAAFPLIGVAALAIARLQAPGGDRESAIDGLVVMVAMATVLSVVIYRPDGLGADASLAARMLHAVVAPLMMSAVTAATFRLLFVGSLRLASAWFVVAAAASGLVGNTARAWLIGAGTYERGTWTDVFVLLSYVFIGLAAVHPSSLALMREASPRARRFTPARLVVLGVALLAAPGTLALRDTSRDWTVPILASVLLTVLVLWRLSGLIVERESARSRLHEQVQRQQALAELGQAGTEGVEVEELAAEATRRCRELLDVARCEVRSDLDIPLVHDGLTFALGKDGRVLLAERAGAWTSEDVTFLQAVANVLIAAIDRQRTQELMRQQAMQDPLTGLPNRALLLERLEQALASQRRTGAPLAVMFLDLDGFKAVNDQYGHRTGDRLLSEIAARLTATMREVDTVGRLAGDEFVVIAERTPSADARVLARRLLTAVARPVTIEDHDLEVRVSIGVAVAERGSSDHAEDLLARADEAMYLAKGDDGRAIRVREVTGDGDDERWATVQPEPSAR